MYTYIHVDTFTFPLTLHTSTITRLYRCNSQRLASKKKFDFDHWDQLPSSPYWTSYHRSYNKMRSLTLITETSCQVPYQTFHHWPQLKPFWILYTHQNEEEFGIYLQWLVPQSVYKTYLCRGHRTNDFTSCCTHEFAKGTHHAWYQLEAVILRKGT